MKMNWIINCLISFTIIYVLGYFYGLYSDISNLIANFHFTEFVCILFIAGCCATFGVLSTLFIKKIILTDSYKYNKYILLFISIAVSVALTIFTFHKLFLILSET